MVKKFTVFILIGSVIAIVSHKIAVDINSAWLAGWIGGLILVAVSSNIK